MECHLTLHNVHVNQVPGYVQLQSNFTCMYQALFLAAYFFSKSSFDVWVFWGFFAVKTRRTSVGTKLSPKMAIILIFWVPCV